MKVFTIEIHHTVPDKFEVLPLLELKRRQQDRALLEEWGRLLYQDGFDGGDLGKEG